VAVSALGFRLAPVDALADARAIGRLSFGLNQGLLLVYALASIALGGAAPWWATLTGWLIGFGANALILYIFWLREPGSRDAFWRFVHAIALFGMMFVAIGLGVDLLSLGAPPGITPMLDLILGVYALAVVIHIASRVLGCSTLRAAGTLAIGVGALLIIGLLAVMPLAGPEGQT